MSKIICIGSVCKDIFFPTSEGTIIDTPDDILSQKKIAFELGAKYKIGERFETIGGCAGNVAVGLSRLGVESSCYGIIGGDESGTWIKDQLEKNGVGTELIEILSDSQSDMSAIIIDSRSADRVIFSNQKANGELIVDKGKIDDAEWIFIGDLHGEWEDNLDRIFEDAKDNGMKIAFNPRQSNIHDNPKKILDCIRGAEVLILNKDESMELVSALGESIPKEDLESEDFLVRKFLDLGAKVAVLTDGERGGWASDGGDVLHVAARNAEAVDSTGAGDACASAYLAAHMKGKGLEECLRWGIRNGASVVEHYGAIEGLLDEEKISSLE
ncbi:MAG: carbohydrate kinase family protein [Candidatus Moranbacteria bacterium]|nr:carbohydrate kinase family protein [Candidatus Moranbacteria bacterium]